MVKLTKDQRLAFENALLTGMTFESAALYAHLPVEQIEAMEEDADEMMNVRFLSASLEQSLLSRMMQISMKQASQGQEKATTWLLEKLYPRYANKGEAEGGAIHLHVNTEKLENMDNVDIVRTHS